MAKFPIIRAATALVGSLPGVSGEVTQGYSTDTGAGVVGGALRGLADTVSKVNFIAFEKQKTAQLTQFSTEAGAEAARTVLGFESNSDEDTYQGLMDQTFNKLRQKEPKNAGARRDYRIFLSNLRANYNGIVEASIIKRGQENYETAIASRKATGIQSGDLGPFTAFLDVQIAEKKMSEDERNLHIATAQPAADRRAREIKALADKEAQEIAEKRFEDALDGIQGQFGIKAAIKFGNEAGVAKKFGLSVTDTDRLVNIYESRLVAEEIDKKMKLDDRIESDKAGILDRIEALDFAADEEKGTPSLIDQVGNSLMSSDVQIAWRRIVDMNMKAALEEKNQPYLERSESLFARLKFEANDSPETFDTSKLALLVGQGGGLEYDAEVKKLKTLEKDLKSSQKRGDSKQDIEDLQQQVLAQKEVVKQTPEGGITVDDSDELRGDVARGLARYRDDEPLQWGKGVLAQYRDSFMWAGGIKHRKDLTIAKEGINNSEWAKADSKLIVWYRNFTEIQKRTPTIPEVRDRIEFNMRDIVVKTARARANADANVLDFSSPWNLSLGGVMLELERAKEDIKMQQILDDEEVKTRLNLLPPSGKRAWTLMPKDQPTEEFIDAYIAAPKVMGQVDANYYMNLARLQLASEGKKIDLITSVARARQLSTDHGFVEEE